MSETVGATQAKSNNRGWIVVFAGLGINLMLGVLYSWSVIKGGMNDWGWNSFEKNLPYSVACLVFCVVMVPAGRMQDKMGPRLVAGIGGLLVGLGMILSSLAGDSLAGFVIGFGILAGAGIGFGYASATPPAVKWFPPAKTGMIAGIVVSGFGLASVYIAPLSQWLIGKVGISSTLLYLGIGFLIIVVALAQLLRPPHRVEQFLKKLGPKDIYDAHKKEKSDYSPGEMLKTVQFYALWFIYACGAGAGLMVISIAKGLSGKVGAGVAAVVALAIGNGAGRIIAGTLSDKLGRKATLVLFLLFQAVMVVLLTAVKPDSALGGTVSVAIIAALVGANYGSNLALFPSITKDYFGLKNFGMNYGLVFTAWGVGGFMLAQLAGYVKDTYNTFTYSYFTSAILLVIAAVMVLFVKPPQQASEA